MFEHGKLLVTSSYQPLDMRHITATHSSVSSELSFDVLYEMWLFLLRDAK